MHNKLYIFEIIYIKYCSFVLIPSSLEVYDAIQECIFIIYFIDKIIHFTRLVFKFFKNELRKAIYHLNYWRDSNFKTIVIINNDAEIKVFDAHSQKILYEKNKLSIIFESIQCLLFLKQFCAPLKIVCLVNLFVLPQIGSYVLDPVD